MNRLVIPMQKQGLFLRYESWLWWQKLDQTFCQLEDSVMLLVYMKNLEKQVRLPRNDAMHHKLLESGNNPTRKFIVSIDAKWLTENHYLQRITLQT